MHRNLGISKAGHDIGRLYVILREEDGRLLVCDGTLKTSERPKKKNPAHVQIIKKLPKEVAELLPVEGELQNEAIKRAIFLYKKNQATKATMQQEVSK